MKQTEAGTPGNQREAAKSESAAVQNRKIHPVVIYPFKQPSDYFDLKALYELIARLDAEKDKYARRSRSWIKTHYAMERTKPFLDFRKTLLPGIRISWMPGAWIPARCVLRAGNGL